MPKPHKGKGRSSTTCTSWVYNEEIGCYVSKRYGSNGQQISWRYANDEHGTGAMEQPVGSNTPQGEMRNAVEYYQQSTYPRGGDVDSVGVCIQALNIGGGATANVAGLEDNIHYPINGTSTAYQHHGAFQQPSNFEVQPYGHGAGPSTIYSAGTGFSLPLPLPNPMENYLQPPAYSPYSTQKLYIAGTPGNKEKLDARYKVHHEKEFHNGRVFKVLWSEPKGAVGGGASAMSRGTEIHPNSRGNSKYGEEAYHSIRRFIVVSDHQRGHSICVPILTYGRRATTKSGVHPEHHAIVYTGKEVPSLIRDEQELELCPIRVEPKPPSEKLDPLSRINYAKPYTVECNVKVLFIGSVHKKYLERLLLSYKKIHTHSQPSFKYDVDEEEDGHQGPAAYADPESDR